MLFCSTMDQPIRTITFDGQWVELRKPPKEESENDKTISKISIKQVLRNSFRKSFSRCKSLGQSTGNQPEFIISKIKKLRVVSFPLAKAQPPTPILIADAPSSDDGADLEDVKQTLDPALLNGSSGNFGSAGARSAPSTPQGIPGCLTEPLSIPCSPGCASPSIQRSPSHAIFTKCDKASLKHLSTSTPAMTAQGQLTEPPSPKAVKDAKKPTTSKARQKKFHRHFPSVEEEEKVLNYYSCALIGDILLQGHLYITKNYFAFYSNVFGYVTKLLIPMMSVEKITKEKTARIIPNAVGITTSDDKHVFGSLMSRDNTYKYMVTVWEVYQKSPEILIEAEVDNVPSESDSSETREGESGRDSPAPVLSTRIPLIKAPSSESNGTTIKDTKVHKLEKHSSSELITTVKDGIQKFSSLPKQSLILFATTLLLITLFLSAAVLLYRISKIHSKYSLVLQDNVIVTGSEDIYNDLLQWQTQLHSKSAGAVHNFLDSNLDQIAKVRQSLEALSTLLMPNNQEGTSKPLEAKDTS